MAKKVSNGKQKKPKVRGGGIPGQIGSGGQGKKAAKKSN